MNIPSKLNLERLSKRDFYLLTSTIFLVAILCVYWIFSLLLFDPLSRVELNLENNQEKFKKIRFVKEEFNQLNSSIQRLKKVLPPKDFNLASSMLNLVDRLKLSNKLQNLKPYFNTIEGYKELSVKFSLEGVTSNELVDFLYRIENFNYLLHVSQIQIRPQSYGELYLLDVKFKIETYTPEER